jgi:hypothetical protein
MAKDRDVVFAGAGLWRRGGGLYVLLGPTMKKLEALRGRVFMRSMLFLVSLDANVLLCAFRSV